MNEMDRNAEPRRSRPAIIAALAAVIVTGLASRRVPWLFPAILRDYPGDAFWAMAAYLGVVLAWPRSEVPHASMAALTISFAVESSQLYHAVWIDAVRRTVFGRLVLGSGFDRYDLVAYVTGVAIAAAADWSLVMRRSVPVENATK